MADSGGADIAIGVGAAVVAERSVGLVFDQTALLGVAPGSLALTRRVALQRRPFEADEAPVAGLDAVADRVIVAVEVVAADQQLTLALAGGVALVVERVDEAVVAGRSLRGKAALAAPASLAFCESA